MRLIDADAFNDWILSHFAEPQSALILTLQGFIAEQPTAYDIDKVVEELKGLREIDMCDLGDCPDGFTLCNDCCSNRMLNKAIEIVKQGGVRKDVSK